MNKNVLAFNNDETMEVEQESLNDDSKKNRRTKKNKKIEKITKVGIPYFIFQKIVDIFSGLVGTLILIPVTLMVYILRLVKHEDDGPIFYTQLRIGKNGKEFKLYKFRTMVMHADEKLFKYLEENKEARKEYKKYKKLKNDPRITKVGEFLRNTSLDELPQMLNILKGQMSLIGPRPYLYREKEDMAPDYYKKIIKVNPGITGYWQVNGRSNVDFQERTYMDTYYIEHRCIKMDIKIIIKTVLKILKKEGAQ